MAGGFPMRRPRHWRVCVTQFDLGRGRELRPFLKLTLDEQAFVAARIAWRGYVARTQGAR